MSTTAGTTTQNQRFLHLKAIKFDFKGARPACKVEVKVNINDELKETHAFSRGAAITWEKDLYISSLAHIVISIYEVRFGVRRRRSIIIVDLRATQLSDASPLEASDEHRGTFATLTFGPSLDTKHVLDLIGTDAKLALASKITVLARIAKLSAFAEKVIDITAKVVELGAAISEVDGTAKAVFEIATLAFKKLQQQRDCHQAAVDFLETITVKLPFADIIPENMRSPQLRASLQSMLDVMERAMRFLVNYAQTPTHKDLLSSQQGAIRELREKLNSALTDFHVCLSAQQLVAMQEAIERAEVANELAQEQKQAEVLKKLNPVGAARFSQGDCCMDGTRMTPLEQIMTWTEGNSPSVTFWAHGLAGCGKSTIAATVCERLRQKGALAGSFFCKSDAPDQRDPRRILPSLSSSLANVCKPYRDLICAALEKETDISTSPLTYQLSTLFVTPFATLQQREGQPLIFVVDALDECGDKATRLQIADCLRRIAALTPWLKVFVTSRPFPELAQVLDSSKSPAMATLDLNEANTESDIHLFTKSRIETLVGDKHLDERWLRKDTLDQLAKKASGLFVWASTVIEFVANEYVGDAAMDAILAGSVDDGSRSSLDSLYTTVLQNTRGGTGGKNMSVLKTVLGIIRTTAKNRPLSVDGLHVFMPASLRIRKDALRAILKDLRSVLYEDTTKDNVIRVCHPSFLDFLEHRDRCEEYWTSPGQINKTMAEKCLNLMRAGLKFNICGLKSAYIANEGISDLKQKLRDIIPESLQYSCLYWTTHWTGTNREIVDQLVAGFFEGLQVLYWLEVLSIIDGLKEGLAILQTIAEIYHNQTKIREVAQEAYRLLSSAYDAISYSTPHLYVSAIAWLPENSRLRLLLYPHFENQPLIVSGRHEEWHQARWVNATGGSVSQVAFAPGGHVVAACSYDETISIWEIKTGLMVMKLKGHADIVLGIAFSPDGRRLVSGSRDFTVRLWDLDTGLTTGEPMMGHTDSVESVCYSPGGKFIASRSYDETVRIWDADSGREVRKLAGHSQRGCVDYSPDGCKLACCGKEGIKVYNPESGELLSEVNRAGHVFHVAFSPNGAYLASSSDEGEDSTIRIWDEEMLTQVISIVLEKHTSYIYSAVFSPDGRELLSASADGTLMRWDTATSQMIGQPFRAHESTLSSAAYSPDGLFIATASGDNTVQLWNADSILNTESIPSYLSNVMAVACSPTGREFASATADGTVRLHNFHSGDVIRTLIGHSKMVRTIEYNRDGMLLVSGSDDYTLAIWNAETAVKLHDLLGHTDCVICLVFTHDGQHIISVSDDGTVRRWNIHSGHGEEILNHTDAIWSVCLSPDGRLLASGGKDNCIQFSDPLTGAELGRRCITGAAIKTLAFAPDGKCVASGSEDFKIQVWDVDTRMQMKCLEGHTNYVLSVTFSPDGKQLMSSSGDATICQWDLVSGVELRRLIGHTQAVRHAVYSTDEKRIISASVDGTTRIWNSNETQKGYVAELDQELPSCPLVDGWIKSREGELLLWVPPEYRNGIRDMCEVCIPADAPGHRVRLDWSKLVRGEEWTGILKDASR